MRDSRYAVELRTDALFPGNGLPPRPGEDRLGLSPFGRLAMGGLYGKSSILIYDSCANAVQQAGVDMIDIQGDDLDACQLAVTLHPPRVIPIAIELLPLDHQNLTGEQTNSEVSVCDFPGSCDPIQWPPLEALVEFGVGGVSTKVIIDYVNGATFSVTASFLRVSALVTQSERCGNIRGTSAAYHLAAHVGPGACESHAQRTVYVGEVADNAQSNVYDLPRFAKVATLLGHRQGMPPTRMIGWIRFWQDPKGERGVGDVYVSDHDRVEVPNAAQYFSVFNESGQEMRMSVMFARPAVDSQVPHMSDISFLKNNAINRAASVGASPPHGPLKTGELPHVQVKAVAGGPQIREGQQKAVTILPPKDEKSAVTTGGLPMISIKMGQNGPQIEDGRDHPVVVKNGKHGTVATGALPMISVKMDNGKPMIQTIPNVAGGPPQIPGAAPVLSAPRAPRAAQGYVQAPALYQGYVARTALPASSQVRVTRIVAPQVALPPVPELSTDQWMLCRHLANTYLTGLLAADPSGEILTEGEPAVSEATQLAKVLLATIDEVLVATAVRAEAAALAAQAPVVQVAPIAASASVSIAPTPSVSHVAGRVVSPARSYAMPGRRAQRNGALAPRGTASAGSGLPMVQVRMEGQRATVQNAAEIAAAKAALEAAAMQAELDARAAQEVSPAEASDAAQG